jgi:citrate lyase subunit beta/citryl-CoA lyase
MSAPAHGVTVTSADLVAGAVTALFVPGDRPERFAKAAASGADVVIIDLEDAVAQDAKPRALAAIVDALSNTDNNVRALVRLNPVEYATHATEVEELLAVAAIGTGHGLLGFMVPKAEHARDLESLAQRLPKGLALVPLIESATGLVNSLELAQVSGVSRLAFGAIDFALDINSAGERVLDVARTQLVVNSRAAPIASPLDSPSTDIKDTGKVSESAVTARDFGFGGKLCIHPAQVPTVKAAFAPTEQELQWARSVIGAEGGAAQVDGHMIDRPVTERARRILQQANR